VTLKLDIRAVSYPTCGAFTISRSSVHQVDVVELHLSDGQYTGRGECRPYPRYRDSVQSVTNELEALRNMIEGRSIEEAHAQLSSGPAKNALDCAWVDYEAKRTQVPVWQSLGLTEPMPRETAYTLSWSTAEKMAAAATAAQAYKFLKLKIGEDGLDRVEAIATARPDARLIIDANEALTQETLSNLLDRLSDLNITLIEQPLPADHTGKLPPSPFPICADEGLQTADDLHRLWEQGYRAVNVKLDKCGGIGAGVTLMRNAKEMGFLVMAGCMVSSSLAMAPMMMAESLCDVIDLDGPLLLSQDIQNGLNYDGPIIHPPEQALWG